MRPRRHPERVERAALAKQPLAVGAIARQVLQQIGAEIVSHVTSIGPISLPDALAVTFEDAHAISPEAALHCVDATLERAMIAEIDRARDAGDTMGGSFEVIARGVPPGLGSYAQWDRKLDGRLAQAVMSIPAIKAVGIGLDPRPPRFQDRAFTTRYSRPAAARRSLA
jgi:chorismate synthase